MLGPRGYRLDTAGWAPGCWGARHRRSIDSSAPLPPLPLRACRWVEAAGGRVTCGGEGVEVSPLVSYAGEGLREICGGGKEFASNYDMHLQAG